MNLFTDPRQIQYQLSFNYLYSCKRIYLDMSKFIEVRATTDIYRKIKIALKFKILYKFL